MLYMDLSLAFIEYTYIHVYLHCKKCHRVRILENSCATLFSSALPFLSVHCFKHASLLIVIYNHHTLLTLRQICLSQLIFFCYWRKAYL